MVTRHSIDPQLSVPYVLITQDAMICGIVPAYVKSMQIFSIHYKFSIIVDYIQNLIIT